MIDSGQTKLTAIRFPGRFLKTIEFPYEKAALIVALQFATTIFEGIGVVTLVPLFELMAAGDIDSMTDQSRLWTMVANIFEWFGFPLTLYSLVAMLLLVVICRQSTKAITQIYYSTVRNVCTRDTRVLGFSRALAAGIAYHDACSTGDLANDFVTETERAMGVIFGVVFSIGSIILLSAYSIIIASITSWSIIAMIVMIAFFGLMLRGIFRRSLQTSEVISALNRELSTFLIEKLQSIRLIRLSRAEEMEKSNFYAISTSLSDHRIKLVSLGARIPLIVDPLTFALVMTFFIVGTTWFGLKFELMIILLGLFVRLLPVVQELATTGQGILASWGSLNAVDNRLRSLSEAREDVGGSEAFRPLQRGIRMLDVGFRYDEAGETPTLTNISLTMPAGKLTALVGPSGAGKSTLVDLLVRLREPNEGRILIDDTPITDLDLSALRNSVAFVPQDPQIINQTIIEHIRYSHSNASDAEVSAAAALAGAAEFIDGLPSGYDTLVGESGIRLSGGQRQRLDLARAVVRPCPILILDEPASGLDAHLLDNLHQALQRIRAQTETTIILIAHGFSLVTDAEQIVVLNEGTVAAIGRHDQLMTEGSWYEQAFTKQYQGMLRAGEYSAAN